MEADLRKRRILVGKPEGKRPLGRPRHKWEDFLQLILKEQCLRLWTGFVLVDDNF
jgi:hypothetical protein